MGVLVVGKPVCPVGLPGDVGGVANFDSVALFINGGGFFCVGCFVRCGAVFACATDGG